MIFSAIEDFYTQISHLGVRGMGLDYGIKKTGAALTDSKLTIALPLCVINTSSREVLLAKIGDIIKRYEVGFLVLGFPDKQYDGSLYKNFAQDLYTKFGLPIYLQDETLSSRLANEMLIDAGIKTKRRNKLDDQVAAQIILESFIDSLQRVLRNLDKTNHNA